jgi:hypothetical protein
MALSPDLEKMNGKYIERYRMATPSPMAMDKGLKSKLWSRSFKWAGLDQLQIEEMLLRLNRTGH